jgi:hypothetical protein
MDLLRLRRSDLRRASRGPLVRLLAAVVLLWAVPAALPTVAGAPSVVPSPETVLGFRPGEDRHLADWGQVLEYLARLGQASDRVRVDEVGRTTEGRPFVLVTVTSAANHARLEEIRRANTRLADPRGLVAEEADRLVRDGKAIVAMAFSIHSTEVGGTLASLRLLHELASSDAPEIRRILDETVLLVLPSHNPDGTQLVAEWYRKQVGTPFEGTPPPVLYHHYAGHDDNRDWYMFTQAETRLTVVHLYDRWHPQIVHDVHQMGARGARIFVPPYIDPWEPNVDPALTAAVNALGMHVASRLTAEGRRGVVTSAMFDAWTPARAYPHTHGGVRILSETASARLATPIEVNWEGSALPGDFDPRAPAWNFPAPWPGGTWRLGDIADYQVAASLAILDHAACNRQQWLRTFLEVNRRACARREPFAFVVPAGQRDPLAAVRLLEVLRTGGVEVHRARLPFEADGRRYEAGTHVVSMQQPASAFTKTILERQRYPDLRHDPGGPPRRPYDVTAHTLPLLLGVEAEAVSAPFTADLEREDVPRVAPGRIEGRAGYLALGHASGDMIALGRLLRAGVGVRWATEAFADAGRSFPAGALLVPASAREALRPLARELGLVARAVHARPSALRLRVPRVGVYASWVPAIDEGWTRFIFEKEMEVPYVILHDRDARAGRLRDRFDAIVLPAQPAATILNGHPPGGMPPEFTGGLGGEGVTALRAFVEAGGTLVALDSATTFAIEQLSLPVKDALAGADPRVFFCPGSILKVRTDPASPLAAGLPETMPVWFEGSPAFEVQGGTVLARYEDTDPLLSGWLLGGERLKGKAALVEVPLGKGRVVLFGFRPQYRAQSRVTYAALLNALYLSAAGR